MKKFRIPRWLNFLQEISLLGDVFIRVEAGMLAVTFRERAHFMGVPGPVSGDF